MTSRVAMSQFCRSELKKIFTILYNFELTNRQNRSQGKVLGAYVGGPTEAEMGMKKNHQIFRIVSLEI